jgi:hypothetical protein
MNIKELFKDSLSYPTQDIDKLLALGVLFFFDAILSLFPSITIALNQFLATQILYFFSNIVGIIVMILAGGYLLDIIKCTLENTEKDSNKIPQIPSIPSIPSLNIVKNLLGGIKIGIVSIIYYIIPIVLTIIISYLNGTFNFITKLIYSYMYLGPEIIASDFFLSNLGNILLILIVAVILFILMSLVFVIAIARLADTNSIKSALNIKQIFSDISKIKWLNYIIYSIIFVLILVIILIISVVISVIPFLGLILLFLVVMPFITMFLGRTLGLVYKKSKLFES